MTLCPNISLTKSSVISAILPILEPGNLFAPAIVVVLGLFLGTGCQSIPSTSGTWTGRVHTVQLEGRGRSYSAASLEILSGPDVGDMPHSAAKGNPHDWMPNPILVDNDDRIMDPGSLRDGALIQVLGKAGGGAVASNEDGWALDYRTPPDKPWLLISSEPVMEVCRATTADGKPIELRPAR